MKKKYQGDKERKLSFEEKYNYCLNFSKHLESLFEPLGHDHRDFKELSKGEFFLDESINYDYEQTGEETNDILVCEKVSDEELNNYVLSDKDSVEKLFLRLKELGK